MRRTSRPALWLGAALFYGARILLAADDSSLKTPPKNAVGVPLAQLLFDADPAGQPPVHFAPVVTADGSAAHWEVQRDPLAPGRHQVLAQTGRTEPGDHVALALFDGPAMEHGEAAIRFRIQSGEDDQSAGIVWRYKDPQTYYLVRASAKDDACSVYRVQKGKRKLLETQQVVITPYTWHDLHVVFVQKSFSVFVDGELIIGGKDSHLPDAGKIGLGTFADSVVRFDDFRYSR